MKECYTCIYLHMKAFDYFSHPLHTYIYIYKQKQKPNFTFNRLLSFMLCNDLFVFFLSHTFNNECANKGKCSIINWRQLDQLKILSIQFIPPTSRCWRKINKTTASDSAKRFILIKASQFEIFKRRSMKVNWFQVTLYI